VAVTETEWVALITVGGALASAALASAVTYRVTLRTVASAEADGEKQREHDAKERKLDRDHEMALSVEERHQQRLRDAYVTFQVYVGAWGRFADWKMRTYETDPPQPEPVMPVIDAEAEAISSLLASRGVVESLEVLNEKVDYLRIAMGDHAYWESMKSPDLPGSVQELAESGNRMREAAERLSQAAHTAHNLMRQELGAT